MAKIDGRINPNKRQPSKRDGYQIALDNDKLVLKTIGLQGWIRESELPILTGMSDYMTSRTCIRLRDQGRIKREWCCITEAEENALAQKTDNDFVISREVLKSITYKKFHYYGFFLRLTPAGAESIKAEPFLKSVPMAHWRHDAGAIRCLDWLKNQFQQDRVISEAELRLTRSFGQKGKISDGTLYPQSIYFEFERTHKRGDDMEAQTVEIRAAVERGESVIVAYPYQPPEAEEIFTDNHELSNTNAIGHALGGISPLVKFVRCWYDTETQYKRALPTAYELIDMPQMTPKDREAWLKKSTTKIKKGNSESIGNQNQSNVAPPVITAGKVIEGKGGWNWKSVPMSKQDESEWELYYQFALREKFKFVIGNVDDFNTIQIWSTPQSRWLEAYEVMARLPDSVKLEADMNIFVRQAQSEIIRIKEEQE